MKTPKKTKQKVVVRREEPTPEFFEVSTLEQRVDVWPVSPESTVQSYEPPRSKKRFLFAIGLFALVLGGYFVWRFWYSSTSPTDAGRAEVAALVAEVGKLIELPEDEEPAVATVSDPGLLKGQEFLRKAEVGDKVLVYPKAGKALLYSPKKHKLIEVAPLSFPNEQPKP